jgi:hypothetical protein
MRLHTLSARYGRSLALKFTAAAGSTGISLARLSSCSISTHSPLPRRDCRISRLGRCHSRRRWRST